MTCCSFSRRGGVVSRRLLAGDGTQLGDRDQQNTRACAHLDIFPQPFRALTRELSEPRFLGARQQITGIKQWLPEPYPAGGGLHLSGSR
jgi:hypothetical protein